VSQLSVPHPSRCIRAHDSPRPDWLAGHVGLEPANIILKNAL
jgi:hypothetical protein